MLEMKGGSVNTQIVYEWEKLPVYAWVNQFGRMIGRLFARLPAQHTSISRTLPRLNRINGETTAPPRPSPMH